MTRWGHGHSFGAGALLAASLLHGDYLWTLSAAFVAGAVLGRAWGFLGGLLRQAVRQPWPVIEGARWRRVR